MTAAIVGVNWRFLVVEDQETIVRQIQEAVPSFVEPPDSAEAVVCATFKAAAQKLVSERFDLLILDLKDDSDITGDADDNPAGLKTFEELKRIRFVPVVFYTALAHKVRSQETTFVRVVEKTEGIGRLKEEVRRVLGTRLPWLMRQVDEIQRSYMWGFVSSHWKEYESPHEQVDLAYVLARRLALTLENEARKLADHFAGKGEPSAARNTTHPMEMYVRPPIGEKRRAGDVIFGELDDVKGHWLILTPSCDFEQKGRLRKVLVAQCLPLSGEPEFAKWSRDHSDEGDLKALIGDSRSKVQSDRFKFLPGTYFLPDLVVDFQCLNAISPDQLAGLEVVASLDSPFAEAVLTRFARYYGRLGTVDIDKNVVLSRLKAKYKPSTTTPVSPEPSKE
jgi:CheY-like chemotaxis protein